MSNRLQQLQQMLEVNPDDSFLLFAIAQEFQQREDLEKAIAYYLKLQQSNPEYVGLYYHLAKAYEDAEIESKALETYEQGIVVAQKLKDLHAESELRNAKLNFEMGIG